MRELEGVLAELVPLMIAECDRAVKQYEQFRVTGIRSVWNTGAYDTVFGHILRKYLAPVWGEHEKEIENISTGKMKVRPLNWYKIGERIEKCQTLMGEATVYNLDSEPNVWYWKINIISGETNSKEESKEVIRKFYETILMKEIENVKD